MYDVPKVAMHGYSEKVEGLQTTIFDKTIREILVATLSLLRIVTLAFGYALDM